ALVDRVARLFFGDAHLERAGGHEHFAVRRLLDADDSTRRGGDATGEDRDQCRSHAVIVARNHVASNHASAARTRSAEAGGASVMGSGASTSAAHAEARTWGSRSSSKVLASAASSPRSR